MRKLALALLLVASTSPAYAKSLVGRHKLTLQWIGWDQPGEAIVDKDSDGNLRVHGEQRGAHDDVVTIDGKLSVIDARTLDLDGTVIIKVALNNHGQQCERHGVLRFVRSGKRRYWRMQQMQSPCENVVDYVDLYQ